MMDQEILKRETETNKRDSERSGSLLRSFADCQLRAVEGEGNERKFKLSFSSEEPYDRWWGTEILSHAEGAVNLQRLSEIGCVLYNHNRDKVIGKVLSVQVSNGRGEAEIEFDDDAESEIIFKKVQSGTLKGVSVGYMVEVWEDVAANKKSSDGRFTGPCSVATRWTPYEISIVSVPADPTVGVGRSHEPEAGNKGVSSFYFEEKQLQINTNFLKEVTK